MTEPGEQLVDLAGEPRASAQATQAPVERREVGGYAVVDVAGNPLTVLADARLGELRREPCTFGIRGGKLAADAERDPVDIDTERP